MTHLIRRMSCVLTNAVMIAFAVVTLSSVSACGQKGPLFLPGDPSQIRPEPVELEQGENDEDGEDDSAPR